MKMIKTVAEALDLLEKGYVVVWENTFYSNVYLEDENQKLSPSFYRLSLRIFFILRDKRKVLVFYKKDGFYHYYKKIPKWIEEDFPE